MAEPIYDYKFTITKDAKQYDIHILYKKPSYEITQIYYELGNVRYELNDVKLPLDFKCDKQLEEVFDPLLFDVDITEGYIKLKRHIEMICDTIEVIIPRDVDFTVDKAIETLEDEKKQLEDDLKELKEQVDTIKNNMGTQLTTPYKDFLNEFKGYEGETIFTLKAKGKIDIVSSGFYDTNSPYIRHKIFVSADQILSNIDFSTKLNKNIKPYSNVLKTDMMKDFINQLQQHLFLEIHYLYIIISNQPNFNDSYVIYTMNIAFIKTGYYKKFTTPAIVNIPMDTQKFFSITHQTGDLTEFIYPPNQQGRAQLWYFE